MTHTRSLQLCQVSLDPIEPQKAQLMITDRLSLQGLQTLLLEEYGESHCVPVEMGCSCRVTLPVSWFMCCIDGV